MNQSPLVSVVMPVYNGERFLDQAIESILFQTYQNFEFILINDGSTDHTRDILKKYQGQITIIDQQNQGVVASLNRGIEQANGKYIARLDADDVSKRNRLEVQVGFLEHNPDIGILGSTSQLIDSRNNNWGIQKVPISDANIRWMSFFKSPFIHPSVIFRKDLVDQNKLIYRKEFAPAEDYDLWVRILKLTKGANLKFPLVYCRVHGSNITKTKRQEMLDKSKLISAESFHAFFPKVNQFLSSQDLDDIRELLNSSTKRYKEFRFTRGDTVLKYLRLWENYLIENRLSQEEIDTIQNQVLIRACQMAFFPPLANNYKYVIREMDLYNRKWPFIFLRSIPVGLGSFIRERLFWKLDT